MASGIRNEMLVKDDELLTLDALLAEVDDKELECFEPQFGVNSLKKISDDNAGNFLPRKFNEFSDYVDNPLSTANAYFGKDIKKEKVCQHSTKVVNKIENLENIKKMNNGCEYTMVTSFNKKDAHIDVDPIFGLRILSPQISRKLLMELMVGRKFVTFNDLGRLDVKTPSDWVIAAVLLSKEVKCTSKNFDCFTIWKLSDLQRNMRTITIYLFKNAHKELWKTSPGTCVAILNPSFNEKKSSIQDIANLSVETAKKVLILGKSKDFGVCKAKTKSGKQCTNFINLQESDFCIFHIQKEFRKIARPFATEKVKDGEYRKTHIACNKSTSGHLSTKKLLQKDRVILDSLNYNKAIENISTNTLKSNVSYIYQKGNYGVASKVEPDVKQRKRDLEHVKSPHLSKYACKKFSENESRIKFKDAETQQMAKQKAFEVIKKCPIKKVNPNSIRGSMEGKKRVLEVLNNSKIQKRRRIVENHDSRISGIFETGSSHRDLVNVRQKEEEEKYFIKFEKREAMEEKMLKTFTISCKAVVCKDCKYTSFSAADRCKTEKHSLKIIDAVKRFFQCKDCGNRTITLFRLPKFSCSNCKGSRWEGCAMVRDQKSNDSSTPLSIRGDEEKFLGSTLSKTNINLLVS